MQHSKLTKFSFHHWEIFRKLIMHYRNNSDGEIMDFQSWLPWELPRSAFLTMRANMERTDVWWSPGVFLGGRLSPDTLALPRWPVAVARACCLEELDVTRAGFFLFWLFTANLLNPSRIPWMGVVGTGSSWLLIEMTLSWLPSVPFVAAEIDSWLMFSFSWLLMQIVSSWLLPTSWLT